MTSTPTTSSIWTTHLPLQRSSKTDDGQLSLEFSQPNPDISDAARAVRGLLHEAQRYTSGPEVLNLLKNIGRFTTLGPYNALLLDAQAPGCRHVEPAHAWEEKWRRRVIPGQRPRVILWPFSPVMLVFDVAQVEPIDEDGPALPKALVDPYGMEPTHGADEAYRRVVTYAPLEGVRLTETSEGSMSAGSARSSHVGRRIPFSWSKRSAEVTLDIWGEVYLNRHLDVMARFVTAAHELAHIFCGHTGGLAEEWRDRRHLGDLECELEAEAVAYICAQRLDPRVTLPPHLYQYVVPNMPPPPVDLEEVTKAAGRIIDLFESPAQVWSRRRAKIRKAAKTAG